MRYIQARVERIILIICCLIYLFVGIQPIYVMAAESTDHKTENSFWEDGPSIEGKSGIVMEASTGTIIYEKNMHDIHYPASITKIMTVLLAIENCEMDEIVTVRPEAVYMEDKVGEEFDGVVSSVTSFGMFIELPNTVEGLSRLANMNDDYYIYDEMTYTIIGERTRKTYRIGDPVRIKVDNVNVDLREIDFKILYKLEDRPQNEGEEQEQSFDDIEE